MATAAVTMAPVLTPQTLGAIADSLERDRLTEKAQSLRQLLPFVRQTVEICFLPLFAETKKRTFSWRFNRLTRDFEPIRLFLNGYLFNVLGGQSLIGLYEHVLAEELQGLLKTAREMDMEPDLIAAAVKDYIDILRALAESASHLNDQPSQNEVTGPDARCVGYAVSGVTKTQSHKRKGTGP